MAERSVRIFSTSPARARSHSMDATASSAISTCASCLMSSRATSRWLGLGLGLELGVRVGQGKGVRATSRCPLRMASESGVPPKPSMGERFAPAVSSPCTTSMLPVDAARCRQVRPS